MHRQLPRHHRRWPHLAVSWPRQVQLVVAGGVGGVEAGSRVSRWPRQEAAALQVQPLQVACERVSMQGIPCQRQRLHKESGACRTPTPAPQLILSAKLVDARAHPAEAPAAASWRPPCPPGCRAAPAGAAFGSETAPLPGPRRRQAQRRPLSGRAAAERGAPAVPARCALRLQTSRKD
jgi:hypothetical protein